MYTHCNKCILSYHSKSVRVEGWRNAQIRCYFSVFLHNFSNTEVRVRRTNFQRKIKMRLHLIDGVLCVLCQSILKKKREQRLLWVQRSDFRCQIIPKFYFHLEFFFMSYHILFLVFINNDFVYIYLELKNPTQKKKYDNMKYNFYGLRLHYLSFRYPSVKNLLSIFHGVCLCLCVHIYVYMLNCDVPNPVRKNETSWSY